MIFKIRDTNANKYYTFLKCSSHLLVRTGKLDLIRGFKIMNSRFLLLDIDSSRGLAKVTKLKKKLKLLNSITLNCLFYYTIIFNFVLVS